MASRKVIVIGAGGHALVVGAAIVAAGHELVNYYDDAPEMWGQRLGGIEVAGPTEEAMHAAGSPAAVLGIGDNHTRKTLAERLQLEWMTVVHPFSWVAPGVDIGAGSVVLAGTVVQPAARIGRHVILNTRSSADHHVEVEDFVHLATAHLAGGSSADEGAFIALGSTVLPGLSIGAWATVGAGSLVKKNVRPGDTVVGVPARAIAFPGSRPSDEGGPQMT